MEKDLLALAKSTFDESTDYIESSLRYQWEKNLYLFRSKHPSGSKYHTQSYKYRSKIFRPKTRSGLRRHCAAAVTAFFSTRESTIIKAQNPSDKDQVVAATLMTHVLEYRLEDTIPWFQTVVGAYTDAMIQGTVISKQYWDFDEKTDKDEPVVDLVPIENFRFSQAATWIDPVASSPYLIHLIPMYVMDIKAKMVGEDAEWEYLEDPEISNSIRQSYDAVRSAREGNREDSKEPDGHVRDHDIAWVHENIVRLEDGNDYVYYTLGLQFLLSKEAVPIEDKFPQGRPFVVGHVEIEPHKQYPAGVVELGEQVQIEANDIANQRLDNIKLALNKRYFARRAGNVDFKSLTRNIPGSVTLMDDINADVKVEQTADVTASSYQEQDRLSTDFDEITGAFSVGSVASNRKLSETVGGMNMLDADANKLAEYQLRVFAETWVAPVLKQLVKLEQEYENDQTILAVAGEKGKLFQKYGVSHVMDYMLDEHLTTTVNVGIGATNPMQRIENLTLAIGTLSQFAPQTVQGLDSKELVEEVMGAVGYRDGSRFYPTLGEEPSQEVQQLQSQVEELTAIIQQKQIEQQGRIEVEGLKQQSASRRQMMKEQQDAKAAEQNRYLDYMDRMIKSEQNQLAKEELELQREQMAFNMEKAEAEIALKDKQSTYQILMQDQNRFGNKK
jgi:hypothetical protein